MRPRFFYGWTIVATLFVINASILSSATFTFGFFVLPMTAALGMSRGAIGWVQTARLLASGVSSITIGRLVDRYGVRVLIPVAAIITGAAMIGLSYVQNAWQFLGLFVLIGLTGMSAPRNTMTSVPVAKWFVRKRGAAMAVATSGLAIGGILFAPLHQAMIDGLGWRAAWRVSGIILVAVVVPASLLFMRRQPEDMGLRPDGAPATHLASAPRGVAAFNATAGGAPQGGPASSPSLGGTGYEAPAWTARQALHTSAMWKLLVAYFLVSFAIGGVMVHRPAFWEERGFDPTQVAFSFSIDSVGYLFSVLLAGLLLDRVPARYVATVSILCFTGSLAWMLLFSNTFTLFGSAVLSGLGAGSGSVVQVYVWAAYFGRSFVGSIQGFVLPVTLVANGLGAPAVGFMYDRMGSYDSAYWMLFVFYLAAAAVMFAAGPPRQEKVLLLDDPAQADGR